MPLRGRWLAAVLACGDQALLSHGAAAALHDLLKPTRGAVDVTIPRRSGRSRPGIRIHRSCSLAAADRTQIAGIPCTSVTRTLIDVAATAPAAVFEKACNQAVIERVLDAREVSELLARHPHNPGSRRLRAATGSEEVGSDRTRTKLERTFLALCLRGGLPRPAVNEWMAIPGEEMQCDFVWHAERVVVEVDGWATHRTKRSFEMDRRRDQLLCLAGWQVVRFTWTDVNTRPVHVLTVVRTMLA